MAKNRQSKPQPQMGDEYLLKTIKSGDIQEVKDILWGKMYKPKDIFNSILQFFDNVELTKEIWSFFQIFPRLKINSVFRTGTNNHEVSFLICAIQNNRFEIFQELLRVPKINVNQMLMRMMPVDPERVWYKKKHKCTPLYFAMKEEKLKFIEELLKVPTLKMNQKCEVYYNIYPPSKFTYMQSAGTNFEILKLLVTRKDLDVNMKDYLGYSKLHRACKNGNLEIVKILFERKDLDVNGPCDAAGNTPLIVAGLQNHVEIVNLLLDHDYINIKAKNHQGLTAISVIHGEEIKEMIRSHSKKHSKKQRLK